jgi:outer membrane protein assembly factor BamB
LKKKALFTTLLLILLTGMMLSMFLGTFNVAKADNQSSDSNGDPNSWPMFHNNLSHTGNSSSAAPITNQTQWRYSTGSNVFSSPAIANGTVYVGSYDHNLYALNATTGSKTWNYTTGDIVWSSPAIASGVVYFGSNDGRVYALNSSTGTQIWNYTTGNAVQSSPTVTAGVVYIGSNDYNEYALNATTGGKIWSYTTGQFVNSSSAVVNGVVYFGSWDGNVYALNATSGAKLWNYPNIGFVTSSSAVDSGVVFIGGGDNNIYALNASDGTQLWRTTTNSAVESSPAVAYGCVYIGLDGIDGKVYALNATTGGQIWVYSTGYYIQSSPAVAGGVVYIGSNNGNVIALNGTAGSKIWSYTTGATDSAVRSSPAVANGVVYVGSDNDNVYAFGSSIVAPTISVSMKIVDRGQTSNLTSSDVTFGTSPYTYQWFVMPPGGNYIAGGTNSPRLNFSTSDVTTLGSWSFMLQVTDSNGATLNSTSVSVLVNPALLAPSLSVSPSTIDQGQTSSLTSSTITSGSSPYTYQWFEMAPGGSYVKVGTNSQDFSFVTFGSDLAPPVTATGTWNFILQVTDSTNAAVNSTTASVTVNVVPTVYITPSSCTLDVGQSKLFMANPAGGSETYSSYQWYVGGVAQIGQSASTFTYAANSAGSPTITATVTDSIGATSAQSTAPSVTVNSLLSVSIGAGQTLDVGQYKTFTASVSGGTPTFSYQWYLNNAAVSSQTSSTYVFTPSATGSNSIFCNVTDSASTPFVVSSFKVAVMVNSALIAPSVSPSLSTVTQGQTSSLSSSTVESGTSPYTYQWFSETPGSSSYSSIAGATSSSYSFVASTNTAAGNWNFILQVTDNAGAAVNSIAASVTVNALAPTPTASPTSQKSPAFIEHVSLENNSQNIVFSGLLIDGLNQKLIANATINIVDSRNLTVYGQATTNESGRFAFNFPLNTANSSIKAVFLGDSQHQEYVSDIVNIIISSTPTPTPTVPEINILTLLIIVLTSTILLKSRFWGSTSKTPSEISACGVFVGSFCF